jgi:hypothetical protein
VIDGGRKSAMSLRQPSPLALATIREGLSSPEAQRLIDKRPSLSGLSKDITAALVLLKCAEEKLFNLLPVEEIISPEDLAKMEGPR